MVKGTQGQGGPNEVEEGATRLLGLDGLTVVRVKLDADGGRTVLAKTTEGFPPGCPKFGVISTSFKGSAVTHPRDVPYGQARVRLAWHKSRWRCRERLCPRGSFTESITAVPARARVTTR